MAAQDSHEVLHFTAVRCRFSIFCHPNSNLPYRRRQVNPDESISKVAPCTIKLQLLDDLKDN